MNPLEFNMNDLIIKHLDGNLNAEESALFDKLYAENPAFQAEVAAFKQTKTAVQLHNYDALKSMLQSEEKRISSLKPVYNYNFRKWAAAASVFIAVICSYIWLKPAILNPKKEQLFAEVYNEPFYTRWLSIVKGGPDDSFEQYYIKRYGEKMFRKLREGWSYYLADRYTESIEIFEKYNIANDTFLLARGSAYLLSNSPKKAIIDFKEIIKNEQSPNKDLAEWYLIAAYIKNNQMNLAKELALKISHTNKHYFHMNASKLLEKM